MHYLFLIPSSSMVKIPYCAHSHSIRGPLMSRFKIILVKMGTIFANFCQIQLLLCIVPTTTSILLRRKILNRLAAQSDQFIAILLCKLTLLSIEVDTNLSLSHCLHHEREKKSIFLLFCLSTRLSMHLPFNICLCFFAQFSPGGYSLHFVFCYPFSCASLH